MMLIKRLDKRPLLFDIKMKHGFPGSIPVVV